MFSCVIDVVEHVIVLHLLSTVPTRTGAEDTACGESDKFWVERVFRALQWFLGCSSGVRCGFWNALVVFAALLKSRRGAF